MSLLPVKQLLASETTGHTITVKGWVRTKRESKNAIFIAINDGSTIHNLQAVAEPGQFSEETIRLVTTGACVAITGTLVESMGSGQKVEVKATDIHLYGPADPDKFPLQPKKHSMEFLREIAHLRPRTNTFAAVLRIRHALAFAVHQYFNDNGFFYLHTPIITASDAEGAGEMFRVTTLDLKNVPFRSVKFDDIADEYYSKLLKIIRENDLESEVKNLDKKIRKIDKELSFEKIIKADQGMLKELSQNSSYKALTTDFKNIYKKIKTSFFAIENNKKGHSMSFLPSDVVEKITFVKGRMRAYRDFTKAESPYLALSFYNFTEIIKQLRNSSDRKIDFSQDFFGRETNLTVSGQLEGELGALALSKIYTFGPTFRAENSNTTRHLAEFWMIEPEMAFYELEDNMNLAEDFVKSVIGYALEHCADDLAFLQNRLIDEEKAKPQADRSPMPLLEKLDFVVKNDFQRLTYTEAIDILLQSKPHKEKKFQYPVGWGIDLQSEHERFLVEKHFKKPVILTNYPREIKSFYMKQDEESSAAPGPTVRAMDVLFPGIGEIIGGSQREDNYEKLLARVEEVGIDKKTIWWFLETRQFGSAPHSGFGLGFERLVLFVTGMSNIRDVIPFPRTPKSAEF
ncbi:asparagine--tRNA ligase [Larkinella humicola]|uniref:asparagine--tRNA ligase n=1 Tax=Larkinella humicola TaxID=2607654 RepID=UPI001CD97EC2|nr:asparagine--tRNA ligase [Larkinella humicola]